MKRTGKLSLFALLAVMFLASCQDERNPTAPEDIPEPSLAQVLPQDGPVLGLIDDIYPTPGLNRSARIRWGNIQRQWLKGEESAARGQVFLFVQDALILLEEGSLLVTSPEPKLNNLIGLLFAAVEIEDPPPVITEDFLDSEDSGWGAVTPSAGADIPTENGWARVFVEPGAAVEPSFLTIMLLPEEACPATGGYTTSLGCWDIDQYGGEPFEYLAETCVADPGGPGEPGGMTDSEYYVEQRLHALEEEAGSVPRALTRVNSTLDCEGFPRGEYIPLLTTSPEDQSVLRRIGSSIVDFLLPDPLAAWFRADRRPPIGLGGVAGSFTWYFGALPLEEDEEYESFPTDPPASIADTWGITEPAAPVALCNLAGGVGCPVGSVESVAISAEARTDPSTLEPPWFNVYFYYTPAGLPGPITPIGSTGVPVVTDEGMYRYWTWTVTLTGGDVPDVGAIDIFAVGQIDPLDGGDLYATDLVSTITVVDVLYDDFTPGTGSADAWVMSAPSAYVALCNEPGGVGCPAGTDVSVDVSARATTDTDVMVSPWSNVHFFYKPQGSSGPIAPIGSTDAVTLTDNSINRFWTSTVTLVGEDIPDLGEIDIFAVGEDAGGDMYSTDPTSTITVVDQTAELPDLVVSSIDLGFSPVLNPGDEVSFDYQMDNLGPAALELQLGGLPSQFDVATYLSTDAILDGADIQLFDGYTGWSFPIDADWGQEGAMLDVGLPEVLDPGVYYLIVKVDAFPGVLYPGVVESNEDNNWLASEPITVQAPTGTITGTVSVDGLGLGATVTLDGGPTQSTGSGGTYSFSNVPLGSHTVSISGFPADVIFPAGTSQPANITSGGEIVPVDFPGVYMIGVIDVRVALDGVPFSPATVTFAGPDGSTQSTDASGNASSGAVDLGTYVLTVSDVPGSPSWPGGNPQTVTISPTEPYAFVPFYGVTPATEADVWVRVLDPAGAPLEGSTVNLLFTGMGTVTNSLGYGMFGNVPVGTYTAELTLPGFGIYGQTVVVDGTEDRVNVVIQAVGAGETPGNAQMRVIVLDGDGYPLPGATVSVTPQGSSTTTGSTTNDAGVTQFVLPVGTHDVGVSLTGYSSGSDTVTLDTAGEFVSVVVTLGSGDE